jgi:hypothetical protein
LKAVMGAFGTGLQVALTAVLRGFERQVTQVFSGFKLNDDKEMDQ